MKRITYLVSCGVIALLAAHLIGTAHASSHQDAPLIIRDPAANTTDVYAILQSYLDGINDIGDAGQNLVQTYTVTKVDHRQHDHRTLLGTGTVPPNNQGIATPFYNQGDNGSNPAKDGVATEAELDRYTTQAIKNLGGGYL